MFYLNYCNNVIKITQVLVDYFHRRYRQDNKRALEVFNSVCSVKLSNFPRGIENLTSLCLKKYENIRG